MSAGEFNVTLCGRDDDAVRASHASSKVLSNSAATVAETKLVGADANNSTVVGAGSAVAINRSDRSAGVVAVLRRDRSGSRLGLRRRAWRSSGGASRRRRRTRSEDTARVRGLGKVAFRRGAGDSRLALYWVLAIRRRLARLGLSGSARLGRADLTASSTHLVLFGASSTGKGVTKRGAIALDERLARVGVNEVLVLGCAALGSREVGNEHVRKLRESSRGARSLALGTSAADLDGCADRKSVV